MLEEVLPQEYTLFSALADELVCMNLDHKDGIITIFDTGKGMDGTPDNCIAK